MQKFMLGFLAVWLFVASVVSAQDTTPAPIPSSYQLQGFNFQYQQWNNCGPATLTTALTYFGYTDDQSRAANWLKPDPEDKNVTPSEMIEFVNSQVPEMSVFALNRIGGTIDLLKQLLANDFVVIIEKGYDPPPHEQGWMGHYLLMVGYDDSRQIFTTHDSYLGPSQEYTYDYINEFWRHFNRSYIVVYESGREPELLQLLGSDADANQNALNALELARQDATANPNDPFNWFNIGSSYVRLASEYPAEAYEYAATAYDEARRLDLPWRMMWYQFGPFEAYNAIGRYDDTITLAAASLNDGGGQFVEETFYYAGVAREMKGETQKALENYREAVRLNSNYEEARAARDRLSS